MDVNSIVNEIPYFKNKKIKNINNIYFDDDFPACFLIYCDNTFYKLRIPNALNTESVYNENEALSILAKNNISNIPHIIEFGKTSNAYIPYLIESYHTGDSLDKIYTTLTKKDWNIISDHILRFLFSLQDVRCENFRTFNNKNIIYNNYGTMLKDRIFKHLEKNIKAGLITANIELKIEKAVCDIEQFFCEEPVFLHFDIKPQNIIYDKTSKNVTIVDYEHSRFGAVSHEIFRGTIAAHRNSYFYQCWKQVKDEYSRNYNFNDALASTYFYELFFFLSELTYANFINDKSLIKLYLIKIVEKLQQF